MKTGGALMLMVLGHHIEDPPVRYRLPYLDWVIVSENVGGVGRGRTCVYLRR
jgi:hypothetical protein